MPTTNQDLTMIADRGLSALSEIKANAVQLAQLAQQIREAQSTLAALEANIAQVKPMAVQIEELDQRIRQKRSELADLDAAIAKKHADHGSITSALRDLRKQISGDPQHA
jgi:chromosome segregation ATPase